MAAHLEISARITIPEEELHWSYARSGGPGGQNVNKVNSKAVLRWNVWRAVQLSAEMRIRFLEQFGTRVTDDGDVVLQSQTSRTQSQNIEDCRERLREMIRSILARPPVRRKTQPTKGSQRRRLEDKARQSERKAGRRNPHGE